jgi:hypothetical protein
MTSRRSGELKELQKKPGAEVFKASLYQFVAMSLPRSPTDFVLVRVTVRD